MLWCSQNIANQYVEHILLACFIVYAHHLSFFMKLYHFWAHNKKDIQLLLVTCCPMLTTSQPCVCDWAHAGALLGLLAFKANYTHDFEIIVQIIIDSQQKGIGFYKVLYCTLKHVTIRVKLLREFLLTGGRIISHGGRAVPIHQWVINVLISVDGVWNLSSYLGLRFFTGLFIHSFDCLSAV